MPAPITSTALIRPELSRPFTEWSIREQLAGHVNDQVLTPIRVNKSAGPFMRYRIEDLAKLEPTLRNARAPYNRSNLQFTSGSYITQEYGIEEVLDDNEKAMYDDQMAFEQIIADRCLDQILRGREVRVAAAVFDTGAFNTTAAGTVWQTHATATPAANVLEAREEIYGRTGMWANTMVVGRFAFNHLLYCAELVDMVKSQNFQDARPGAISTSAVAVALGLDRIIVANGAHDTAAEGQTATPTSIWSQTLAMVCVVATSADFMEPCIGRQFVWEGDGGSFEGRFESYYDDTVRGNVTRCRTQSVEQIIFSDLGEIITDVTA